MFKAPSPFRPAELFWLCIALALLWALAQPMSSQVAASGMDNRYTVPPVELPRRSQVRVPESVALPLSDQVSGLLQQVAERLRGTRTAQKGPITLPDLEATSRQQQRAKWLHGHLPAFLAGLALLGWLALLLGRLRLPWTTQLGLIGALWCVAGAWYGALGWAAECWAVVGVAWVGVAMAWAIVQRTWLKRITTSPSQTAASVWRYPAFVLFSGIGLIWITDLAARGAAKQLFLGVRHSDSLLFAYAALTLTASLTPTLLAGFSSLASRLEVRFSHLPAYVWSGWVLGLLGLMLLTLAAQLKGGWIQASHFGELARVLFWLVSGWLMYRWIDRDKPSRSALSMLLAMQLLPLAAYLLADKGQAMVMMFSLCVPVAVLIAPMALARRIGQRSSALTRVGLAGLLWLPFVAIVIGALWQFGPRLGSHVAERLEALTVPFNAENDFMAQLSWLSHASGAFGFGLTHVPWCGHLGSIGAACRGAPEQIQSDYVLLGVAAVWGLPVAILLVVGLCAWLIAMLRLNPGSETKAHSLLAFRAWIVAFFSVAIVAQVFVTSFGTLGSLPLTGVPLPLLAYGQLGMLVVAVFTGMAMHRWVEGEPSTAAIRRKPLV